MNLNDEEKKAFSKAVEWLEHEGPHGSTWRDLDEGYFEAAVLANLLAKFSLVIMQDKERLENARSS